jgi:hypothetical protein
MSCGLAEGVGHGSAVGLSVAPRCSRGGSLGAVFWLATGGFAFAFVSGFNTAGLPFAFDCVFWLPAGILPFAFGADSS